MESETEFGMSWRRECFDLTGEVVEQPEYIEDIKYTTCACNGYNNDDALLYVRSVQ